MYVDNSPNIVITWKKFKILTSCLSINIRFGKGTEELFAPWLDNFHILAILYTDLRFLQEFASSRCVKLFYINFDYLRAG